MKNDIFENIEDSNKKMNDVFNQVAGSLNLVDPSVRREIKAIFDSFNSNSTSSEGVIKDILKQTKEKLNNNVK